MYQNKINVNILCFKCCIELQQIFKVVLTINKLLNVYSVIVAFSTIVLSSIKVEQFVSINNLVYFFSSNIYYVTDGITLQKTHTRAHQTN